MNNQSNATTVAGSEKALMSYLIYAVEGIILMTSNGLVLGTIVKHEVLKSKKEYVIVAALAFADMANSLGYVLGGIYRSRLIINGKDKVLLSAWECALVPHNLVWAVWDMGAASMLACISTDRLIAVALPLQYFGFGRTYTTVLISIFYLYAFGLGGMVYVSAYTAPRVKKYPAICFLSAPMARESVLWFYRRSRYGLSLASIVIYVIVIVIYRKKSSQVAASTRENAEQTRQQNRFLVTMAWSTLCTFVLYFGMNWAIEVLAGISPQAYYTFSPYADVVKNLNPFMNIVFFTFRHKDLRVGMKFLFSCKPLTEAALKTTVHGSHLNGGIGTAGSRSKAKRDNVMIM